jgi:hypothetical protein
MTERLRLGLVACVGLLALASVAQASAAYAPKTSVISNTNGSTTIAYVQGADDDATARLTFYVPLGATLNMFDPGTALGTATARAAIGAAGGAEASLSGPVVQGNAADPTIQATGAACTGTAEHAAVWILAVALQDQAPLNVPAFVDPTTGGEALFSSAKIVICFRSPNVPENQGGQPLGVKPLEASMTLTATANDGPPALAFPFTGGTFLWTGLFIPYAPGTKTVNPLAAAESQALASLPVEFGLAGKRIPKRHKVGKRRTVVTYTTRLVGNLSENGLSRDGVAVEILAGGKKVATARTNENGTFTKSLPLRKTTTYQARAAAASADTDLTCNPLIPLSIEPLLQPACTGVTEAALVAQSNAVRVKKPK